MNFKVDTKEKFVSIYVENTFLNDNVAAELTNLCLTQQEHDVKNIVLILNKVDSITEDACKQIATLQHSFYEKHLSFVICCMKENIENSFEKLELLEVMNITPTESEAWDIVQMEEIERELMDGNDWEFEKNDE